MRNSLISSSKNKWREKHQKWKHFLLLIFFHQKSFFSKLILQSLTQLRNDGFYYQLCLFDIWGFFRLAVNCFFKTKKDCCKLRFFYHKLFYMKKSNLQQLGVCNFAFLKSPQIIASLAKIPNLTTIY